jgi:hydroxyacylglutathione hydrolase
MMHSHKRFGCFLVQQVRLRRVQFVLLTLGFLVASSHCWAQLAPGSMDVQWDDGAPNCSGNPPLPIQVHRYNARTYILRENLCLTFEAPFMYLLIGSTRAMLIDTGDVADPNRASLAKTVMDLLPSDGLQKLPLLVVHTHRHLDHRAGDGQFAHLANVEVVGFDIDSVKRFYKFKDWPEGLAQIDLGNRTVDVIPTPGHNETEVSFYDRETGLFFSGDFLLPGRLFVDNTSQYLASAERAAAFVKNRPVTFVLGGHIEKNVAGEAFPWESQYHPQEHALQLTKDDLLALPAVIRSFNGFYLVRGKVILMNSTRILIVLAAIAGTVLVGFAWMLIHLILRRKRARRRFSENKANATA